MNADVAKQLKSLSSDRTEYCKAIDTIIVCELNTSRKLWQLSSVELNVSLRLDTALQLNAAHANKTTIEAVNRYSMMLSFVMK